MFRSLRNTLVTSQASARTFCLFPQFKMTSILLQVQQYMEVGKDAPDIDVYVMDMEGSAKKHLKLDALVVRNHAAFAAFACSTKFRNMKKTRYATSHWDPRLPQIGFYATRDIEPGEELTYLRTDGEPDLRKSHTTCGCRLPGCSTRT